MKYPLLSVLLLTLFAACSKDNSREDKAAWLEIRLSPEMNSSAFQANANYSNIYGELLRPTSFKFYLGQFKLTKTDGSIVSLDQYNLVDFNDTASFRIRMEVSPGQYSHLQYQFGVDSARNVSGVQSGPLDPLLGMFWTWNSGYIFLKLEGNSTASNQANGKFEYHIGGFRSPYSAIRTLETDFAADESGPLGSGQTLRVNLSVQMDNFFAGAHPLRIADTANVMTPGERAAQIADNFAACFSTTNYQVQ